MRNFSKKEMQTINEITVFIAGEMDLIRMYEEVMRRLSELIPHEKSFFSCSATHRDENQNILHSINMTELELEQYRLRFSSYDYTAWYVNQPGTKIYRDTDLVDDKIMQNSVIYQDWVKPMGMSYVCGNVIHLGQNAGTDLTLLRSERYGDFSERELFVLSLITAHIEQWFCAHNSWMESVFGLEKDEIQLTKRENEIAEFVCSSRSIQEIAQEMSISYATVRRHLANIYKKLGVSTRIELVNYINYDCL
ncbi:MAG: helix-turn-helix transcriptional regulator [Hespellia sp.]|nr:helix-turn-helix transcriptional regulator [Hespellia sp.]